MTEPWQEDEQATPERGLQRRVARGLSWTVADIWGRQGLNLLVFIVLARLLTPDDFGVVALAAVFVTFAQLVVDQGLGDALIQRRELTRTHIDTAFWASVATSLFLTLIALVGAGPLGTALSTPGLTPILQVLALTFILSAFTSIQIALLRRELAFRSLAIRSLVATAIGGVVGIVAALQGAGAWALVAQQATASAVSVAALWAVSPWKPRLAFSFEMLRQLFPFGIRVMGSDILNFLSRYTSNFLIGVVLGTTLLGLFAVGNRILDVSQTLLLNVAKKIAFPAFARLQDDRERMSRAYLRMNRVAALVIIPGYIGLAVLAPQLTVLVFGHQWAASGGIAAILFLVGPVLSFQAFSDNLLNAAGHPEVVLRYRAITAVTNVVGFIIAVPFGIQAVAAAFTIRAYLLLPLLLRWMEKYAGIRPMQLIGQLRGIAVATVAMAAGMLLLLSQISARLPLLAEVALVAAAGGLLFLGVMVLLDRGVLLEALGVARDAAPRPALLAWWQARWRTEPQNKQR
jgi:O-antigen/teichoic acid export membrane protein